MIEPMHVTIDHKLRIALSELPSDIAYSIEDALSIPNIERQKAMKQSIWGWKDIPEFVKLYEYDSDSKHLLLPRGFIWNLADGLRAYNIDVEFIDNRHYEELPAMGQKIQLRSWQIPAVSLILLHEQGIWKAPAGSGKTVSVLEAIRRSKSPSIVLVNTKDILYQWIARAKVFLGDDYPIGIIGDGKFQISDYLTIATVQTLHSRYDELESSYFFEEFSFVCLDECHHATAETFNKIVDRFTAKIRIGVSATPDKTGNFALATAVLGPIFHVTDPKDVDAIVKPIVFKIPTQFEFDYKGREGRRPSNYPQLIDSLIKDMKRNHLIAKTIMMNPGSHSLVVSKRLEHLELIAEMIEKLGYQQMIFMLTGRESSGTRQMIIKHATDYPCIVFSTLADEALDIPRFDSIFLIYPQRNSGLIEQQVGRICRDHPNKDKAMVFDFVDPLVGPLDAQWKIRRNQVYKNLDVRIIDPQDIWNYKL